MELQFEIGDPASPRGHAIVFFKEDSGLERVGASYIVILPVSVDIAKYVPPFLAGQIESLGSSDMSAFSFPPAPEQVEGGEEELIKLAERRRDDLIFGGFHRLSDAANLMGMVGEITAEYRRLYDAARSSRPQVGAADLQEAGAAGDESPEAVDDLVYGLMSEADLLTELTTLVGRLRYAIEGGDTDTSEDTETRIVAAGRHLPKNRRIDLLASAAAAKDEEASERAALYLERAYALFREDYRRVKSVEDRIKAMTGGELSAGPDGAS